MSKLRFSFSLGRARRLARRIALAALALTAALVILFELAVYAWPYPRGLEKMPRDSTQLLDARGVLLARFTAGDGQWRQTVSEPEISPHLLDAIVAVEDARFYDHHGVDWRSLGAAAWQDLTSLRFRRGASTITMQLQRLRDARPRTVAAKVMQAIRAEQIERQLSKRQILVEYLNRAPFGGNLVGAQAASRRYFGRSCRDLSLAQAALLAGLPKNPSNDRPDRFPERARARRDFVLGRMLALKMITPAAHAVALAEPIEIMSSPLAQEQKNAAVRTALPTLVRIAGQAAGGTIPTTLELPIQEAASAAAMSLFEQRDQRIGDIAVVVVDIETARCLASVSLSRADALDLDLTRCPRSTGSLLKPLIYAAAFDAGIASPTSLLDDSPAAWPGYRPANYDLQFCGRMSAAEALAQSRNIPALRLLARVGVARAVGVCESFGLRTIGRTPQRYGLSLAVGGGEATAAEVAEAYATLARGGVHRPLRWTATSNRADQSHRSSCLSEQSCREAMNCLNDPSRTAAISPQAAALRVAWKTGTSSGHRDAWCAAIGPTRVVVVWMGNADGAGSKALVGADAAAPLALNIIAAIESPSTAEPRRIVRPPAIPAIAPPVEPRLSIVSPTDRAQIIWQPDAPASHQKVMLRATRSGADESEWPLTWFVDGTPVGSSNPGESIGWAPSAGEHEVHVVDASGLSDQVTIRVSQPVEAPGK